ncbi:hypothetical protein [Acinetobacter dispersus]|uniref:hypothetical protein n=1 Tax=Acinetobacter dispersus TaxID=70348 RepID=UPI00142F0849|nr:hypothetical protein [Acinetobacter dispersus]
MIVRVCHCLSLKIELFWFYFNKLQQIGDMVVLDNATSLRSDSDSTDKSYGIIGESN